MARIVRAGLARERQAKLAGRIPETFIVPVSGAPYPRRGAMVVPSGIAQAFPGRSHLAIHGQIGPSRHHHCPAHFATELSRVRTPPGPFYEVGFVALSLPRSAGIGWARPGPCLARDGQTPSLQIPSCPSTGSGHSHLGDGVGRHPITRRVETLTAFQYSIHNVQQLAHAGHDDLFGPLAVRA